MFGSDFTMPTDFASRYAFGIDNATKVAEWLRKLAEQVEKEGTVVTQVRVGQTASQDDFAVKGLYIEWASLEND